MLYKFWNEDYLKKESLRFCGSQEGETVAKSNSPECWDKEIGEGSCGHGWSDFIFNIPPKLDLLKNEQNSFRPTKNKLISFYPFMTWNFVF